MVSMYFFNSAFPHGFANLKSSAFENYKTNTTDNYTSIFDSHSDYYDALTYLNIKE
jgi:hypothetical protein